MKVPTYEAKLDAPRQGQGRFLTAQLSPSAMIAPSRAAAEQAQQLARTGDKIAEFGFKKLEAGAKQEAQTAANAYAIELSQAEGNFLQSNVADAETLYKKKSQQLYKKYRGNLSNSFARSEFANTALRVQAQGTINFVKRNNKRVLEQTETNTETEVQGHEKNASDPTQTLDIRYEAVVSGANVISRATSILGDKKGQALNNQFYKNITENTMIAYMNKPQADVLSIVQGFREGDIEDNIVLAGLNNISDTDRNEIASNLLKRANNIIKERKAVREREEDDSNAANDAMYNSIVNANLDNPASKKTAIDNYERLLAAGYFEKPSDRAAIARLLDLDDVGETGKQTFAKKSLETDKEEGLLAEKEAANELSITQLNEAKRKITFQFYKNMLSILQSERGQAESEALDIFRDVYGYTEAGADANVRTVSQQAFRSASRKIREFIRKNPRVPFNKIIEQAETIVANSKTIFEDNFKREQLTDLVVAYSRLPPNLKSKIPDPNKTSIASLRPVVASLFAKKENRNFLELKSFLDLLNKKIRLDIFK